jgi:hypothetical protein
MASRRIKVDFNELVTPDELLLSQKDSVVDEAGNPITLIEGATLGVYEDDPNNDGAPDRLIADGTALLNHYGGWTSAAKWLLKIDSGGIRRLSDEIDGHET